MVTPTDPADQGPGRDPRAGRHTAMVRFLEVALGVTLALAIAQLVAPSGISNGLGAAMVGILVLVPLARALWLVVRWFGRGDVKFGLVGLGLLAVIAFGLVLSH